MSLNRKFTVEGIIECVFKPEDTETESFQPDVQVEIWYKSPLNVLLLGSGPTDVDGKFSITFEVDTAVVEEGKINNAFLKVYYKGILITGDNPYINPDGITQQEVEKIATFRP
jgi:hypothetical protein